VAGQSKQELAKGQEFEKLLLIHSHLN